MELSTCEISIIQRVSEQFKLPVEKVYCRCRKREIVEVRHFLIIYFVLELRHDIRAVTAHFGGLNTSNFYHGLTLMVSNHKFNRLYRQRLTGLFPMNGTEFDSFWMKVLEKKQQIEADERY
ncbi:MAG: hypothetical protein WC238_06150 [Parcubacteria group bacterium]|jgi:hypothetical protein